MDQKFLNNMENSLAGVFLQLPFHFIITNIMSFGTKLPEENSAAIHVHVRIWMLIHMKREAPRERKKQAAAVANSTDLTID